MRIFNITNKNGHQKSFKRTETVILTLLLMYRLCDYNKRRVGIPYVLNTFPLTDVFTISEISRNFT